MTRLAPFLLLALPGIALAGGGIIVFGPPAPPDYVIGWMTTRCSPETGAPQVEVSVFNQSDALAPPVWVDLFVGRPSPPWVGEIGDPATPIGPTYSWTGQSVIFDIPWAPRGHVAIDVILDTENQVPEADEWNNRGRIFTNFSGCP
jgi:hypothetical protein